MRVAEHYTRSDWAALTREATAVETLVGCPFCLADPGIRCRGGFGVRPQPHDARRVNATGPAARPGESHRRALPAPKAPRYMRAPDPICPDCHQPVHGKGVARPQGVVTRLHHQECVEQAN